MVRESMTPADSRYFLKASFFCSVACGVTSRGEGRERKVRDRGWAFRDARLPFQNGTKTRRKPRDSGAGGCIETTRAT